MERNRLELIMEMLDKNPEDSFLNYAAALEFKKIGNQEKAIEIIESIVDRDRKYIGSYYQLGKLYEEKDQQDKAIKIYKEGKVVARELNDVKALGELSEALLILDDSDENWDL